MNLTYARETDKLMYYAYQLTASARNTVTAAKGDIAAALKTWAQKFCLACEKSMFVAFDDAAIAEYYPRSIDKTSFYQQLNFSYI